MEPGRLVQIGYVARAIDEATSYLTEAFGARRLTRFDDLRSRDGGPAAIRDLSHFELGGMEIEVIEPPDPWPGSIYLDPAPDPERPVTLHHIGYLTTSREEWRSAVDAAPEAGTAVPASGEWPDLCFAHLDTRPRCGHFTEVVHRGAGVAPGGVRSGPGDRRPATDDQGGGELSENRERGLQLMAELNPHLAGLPTRDDGFANELRELSIDMAFGQIWSRPGLSRRDRSIFTLGLLVALRAEGELAYHFPMALRNGVSVEELEELIYQAVVYAGFPAAHAAQLVARRTLPSPVGDETEPA